MNMMKTSVATLKSPLATARAAKMAQRPVSAKMSMPGRTAGLKESAVRSNVVTMAKGAAMPDQPIVCPTEGEVCLVLLGHMSCVLEDFVTNCDFGLHLQVKYEDLNVFNGL